MKISEVKVTALLGGHVSPETAYVVKDYPYGFRLRCQIRYWLEYVKGKGVRFWSQTTNPKKAGEVWNKPKTTTYCLFGGAMYLDEENHVQWYGLTMYSDLDEAEAWTEKFGPANHPAAVEVTAKWLRDKRAYEAARANGLSMRDAARSVILGNQPK